MTDHDPALPVSAACPLLALQGDRSTHAGRPSTAHLCHAFDEPARIELAHQSRFCLTAAHVDCPRFAQAEERGVERARVTALGGRTGREEERLRPTDGQSLSRRVTSVLGALLVVAVLAGVGAFLSNAIAPLAGSGASTSPGAASPAASAIFVSQSLAPATPIPTPSAVPSPTTRSTSVVYVVKQGDTLGAIAAHFGVQISDIVAANNLKDPNRLTIGQKLTIPPPPEPASGY